MRRLGFFDNEAAISEAVGPIESAIVDWWLRADQEHQKQLTVEQRDVILGPSHRGVWVQKYALHHMRTDPITITPWRPGLDDQLEYLAYDGEDGDLAILFLNLHLFGQRLRSNASDTYRQIARRNDELTLDGRLVFPLVCGPRYDDGVMVAIYYGHETMTGFDWYRQIWSAKNGVLPDRSDKQQPLTPDAIVKIRRDVAAATEPRRIGVAVRELAEQAKAAKQSKKRRKA